MVSSDDELELCRSFFEEREDLFVFGLVADACNVAAAGERERLVL